MGNKRVPLGCEHMTVLWCKMCKLKAFVGPVWDLINENGSDVCFELADMLSTRNSHGGSLGSLPLQQPVEGVYHAWQGDCRLRTFNYSGVDCCSLATVWPE